VEVPRVRHRSMCCEGTSVALGTEPKSYKVSACAPVGGKASNPAPAPPGKAWSKKGHSIWSSCISRFHWLNFGPRDGCKRMRPDARWGAAPKRRDHRGILRSTNPTYIRIPEARIGSTFGKASGAGAMTYPQITIPELRFRIPARAGSRRCEM